MPFPAGGTAITLRVRHSAKRQIASLWRDASKKSIPSNRTAKGRFAAIACRARRQSEPTLGR
jgi:hypothetical protein